MNGKRKLAVMIPSVALLLCSCAALQPPSATGPRSAGALYPITLKEDNQRNDATIAALNRLAQIPEKGAGTEAQLQPVTGTILSLPATARNTLYLPKVGAGAVMTEEETRESLRRFIRLWQDLIGADPVKLSLVERTDQPDGTKIAKYEQRPFRYPIRGNYGKLQIVFTSDRRVLDVNSTCIPDADQIQTAFSNLTFPRRSADTIKQLREKGISYTDSKGNQMNFTIPASSELTPLGLTTYIQPAAKDAKVLEFHIAWEVQLANGPVRLLYVDALTGDVIAVA
jgi:hypothetical protein